jgi:hypothetical protein
MFIDLGRLLNMDPANTKVVFMFVSAFLAEILGTLSILVGILLGHKKSYTLEEIEFMQRQVSAATSRIGTVLGTTLEKVKVAPEEPVPVTSSPLKVAAKIVPSDREEGKPDISQPELLKKPDLQKLTYDKDLVKPSSLYKGFTVKTAELLNKITIGSSLLISKIVINTPEGVEVVSADPPKPYIFLGFSSGSLEGKLAAVDVFSLIYSAVKQVQCKKLIYAILVDGESDESNGFYLCVDSENKPIEVKM